MLIASVSFNWFPYTTCYSTNAIGVLRCKRSHCMRLLSLVRWMVCALSVDKCMVALPKHSHCADDVDE